MRDRRVMVKAALMTLAAAFIVVGGAASALADELIVVKVPFAFIVGDRQMPAGDYMITEATNDSSVLWISSRDGGQAVCVLTIPPCSRKYSPNTPGRSRPSKVTGKDNGTPAAFATPSAKSPQ